MQTIYPLSLLAQLTYRELNGCLQISSGAVTWSIYLEKGKLVYASNSLEPFERLDRHLTRLSHQVPTLVGAVRSQMGSLLTMSPLSQSAHNSDYQAICWLVDRQYLNPAQAAILIEGLAREVFESLSLVRQGACEIIESGEFTQFPKFCQIDISQLTNHLQKQLQQPKFSVSPLTLSSQSPASPLPSESDISTNSIQNASNQFNTSIKSTPATPVQNNYTIACIDDNPSVLKTINMFLDAENYAVVMINNPLKALMQIIRCKPDLILLDVTMPNLDGYELCSLLRRHSSFKNTPIIMVTGNSGLIDRARAKLVRSSDYLTKPFTQSDLLKIVRKYLP
jgi:two-component system, chemotaxis family, response regulator PixG